MPVEVILCAMFRDGNPKRIRRLLRRLLSGSLTCNPSSSSSSVAHFRIPASAPNPLRPAYRIPAIPRPQQQFAARRHLSAIAYSARHSSKYPPPCSPAGPYRAPNCSRRRPLPVHQPRLRSLYRFAIGVQPRAESPGGRACMLRDRAVRFRFHIRQQVPFLLTTSARS